MTSEGTLAEDKESSAETHLADVVGRSGLINEEASRRFIKSKKIERICNNFSREDFFDLLSSELLDKLDLERDLSLCE